MLFSSSTVPDRCDVLLINDELLFLHSYCTGIDILPTALAGGFPQSLAGFPASLRLAGVGFHRPRSYGLSTGIEDREPHGPYIFCRIHISVMMHVTFWTCPLAYVERERFEDISTIETSLTGGIPLINGNQISTVPVCFVFEQGHKLTPPHIRDGFA